MSPAENTSRNQQDAEYVVAQRTAFEHRCYLAGETVHPRFASLLPGKRYSLVLTVNTGYE